MRVWSDWLVQGVVDSFWGPRGIAVDSQGHVLVTDTGKQRVVVFDNGRQLPHPVWQPRHCRRTVG